MSLILRFRDLYIPDGETIRRHRSRCVTHGYVWWGWIMRQREAYPAEWLSRFNIANDRNGERVYLFHSGECLLYEATLIEIASYPGGLRIQTPEVQKTPGYMSEAECPMWFQISSIGQTLPDNTAITALNYPTLPYPTDIDHQLLARAPLPIDQLRLSTATLWDATVEVCT